MSEDRSRELVELAAVVRSHGLRGELVLKLFNRESTLLEELEQVLLKARDGNLATYTVERARPHGEFVLLVLREIRSREQADALRGSLVCLARDQLPAPDDGEYYLIDLIGLEVRGTDDQPVGRVRDVVEYPSVHAMVVDEQDGTREVPVLDRYLVEVDIQGGFVKVDHLDELELVARKAGS